MENNNTIVNNTNPTAKPAPVRCAIYARCASGLSEQSSAAVQILTCTEYANKRGWEVAQDFVQADVGASGVLLMGCKSLMYLLEAADKQPRPFDCVLIADISRLARSLDRVTTLVNSFHGRGVFIQTVHGEFDSRNLHPGAWAAKSFLSCIPQYLKPTAGQCPMCGKC